MKVPSQVLLFTRALDGSTAHLQELEAQAAAVCPEGEAEVHAMPFREAVLLVDDPTPEQVATLQADGWESTDWSWSARDGAPL